MSDPTHPGYRVTFGHLYRWGGLTDGHLSASLWRDWQELLETPDEEALDRARALPQVKRGRQGVERDERRMQAEPIIQAALLMLFVDSIGRTVAGDGGTYRESGPDALKFRDSLINQTEGDLVRMMKELDRIRKASGMPTLGHGSFTQGQFKSTFDWSDHGELHQDVITYLFRPKLLRQEVDRWVNAVTRAIIGDRARIQTFDSGLRHVADTYLGAQLDNPLNSLRRLMGASLPHIDIVMRGRYLMSEMYDLALTEIIDLLTQEFGRTYPNELNPASFGRFSRVFLDGAVIEILAADGAPRGIGPHDDRMAVKTHAECLDAFEEFFTRRFQGT